MLQNLVVDTGTVQSSIGQTTLYNIVNFKSMPENYQPLVYLQRSSPALQLFYLARQALFLIPKYARSILLRHHVCRDQN